jgi:flagellar biosynthetic protein FlhB
MADEDFESKTEAPTQRRREEARQQGMVAFSMDFAGAIQLLVAVIVLAVSGASLGHRLVELARRDLGGTRVYPLDPLGMQGLFGALVGSGAELLGLLLGMLFAAGLAMGLLQTGFHFAPELLTLRWERLSFATGWNRLFSFSTAVRALTSLLKVALVVALAYWVIKGRAVQIAFLSETTLTDAVARTWDLAMRLALAIASGLVLIGVLDYGYQRFRLERSLRMTRQELKEEIKREDGDPQIKGRVRRLQREMAQRRMMREVPKATVVITNPTHLAVALRYDRSTMASPRLIAKGAGFVAERIMTEARLHHIPIVERPSLAQALYRTVKIGQEIPAELYYVVAEVLAYVYRLRGMV